MSVDVVCAGVPFLDISFTGFERMPALGEERMAETVEYTPGGLANIALGLTRLGLRAAMWSPVGDDISGRMLTELLAGEGIDWVGPPAAATGVSVVMPLNGDRGFLTVCPEFEIDTDALAALEPRAVVIDLPMVDRAPAGADVHAVVGDVDAQRLAGRLPAALADARTLVVNEPEALHLTGLDDVDAAARALAGHGPTTVVTLGAGGAVCAGEHGLARAPAPEVAVIDTNGAGDLFTAAWVWADLAGASPEERMQLAVAYASLSVRVATTRDGALTLDAFRREAPLLDAIIPPKGARR
jgi:sugar/nucleoside kinase (ribokinase family)